MIYRWLVLTICLLGFAGCVEPRSDSLRTDYIANMRVLPPATLQTLVGEWEFPGEDADNALSRCTLSIVLVHTEHLLVQNCFVSTGCCNGSHGMPLTQIGATEFFEPIARESFVMLPNSELSVRSLIRGDLRLLPTPLDLSLSAHSR